MLVDCWLQVILVVLQTFSFHSLTISLKPISGENVQNVRGSRAQGRTHFMARRTLSELAMMVSQKFKIFSFRYFVLCSIRNFPLSHFFSHFSLRIFPLSILHNLFSFKSLWQVVKYIRNISNHENVFWSAKIHQIEFFFRFENSENSRNRKMSIKQVNNLKKKIYEKRCRITCDFSIKPPRAHKIELKYVCELKNIKCVVAVSSRMGWGWKKVSSFLLLACALSTNCGDLHEVKRTSRRY